MQVNPDMVPCLEDAGLSFTGKDETGQRMEVWDFGHNIIFTFCQIVLAIYATSGDYELILALLMQQVVELPNHPYYIGVQFHPEFKSRPGKPSALFLGTSLTPSNIGYLSFNLLHLPEFLWHTLETCCFIHQNIY